MSITHTHDHTTDNNHQWMQQFYENHQPLMEEALISDSTVVTTSSDIPIMGPSSSFSGPKPAHYKPIRRRSRASKRTPTTLLNANTTNFRALVQQFTGCPSTNGMSFGFHNNKGPITLSFQHGRQQQPPTTTSFNGNPLMIHPPQQADLGVLQRHQQQPSFVQDYATTMTTSFEYNNSTGHHHHHHQFLSNSDVSNNEGMVMDHNFSLQDLLQ